MRALLGVVVVAFSLSCLAESKDAPKDVPPVPDKAASANKTDANSQRQNPITPPPVNVFVSNGGNANTSGEKETSKHEATNWAEWLVAIATAILAGITWGLVHYTKKLWRSTNTVIQDAKISSERQLRAYVSVHSATIEGIESGKTPNAKVIVKNFGKTPAYGLNSIVGLGIETDFAKLKEPTSPDLRRSMGNLGPGATNLQRHDADGFILTDAHIALLKSGAMTLWVYAEMRYTDAFEIERLTKYRLQVGGKSGFHENSLAVSEDGNNET